MTAHPHRLKRIRSFITLAGDELKAVKLLSQEVPRPALFLAQQVVDKLLRAVIEAEDQRAGPTHNIRELVGIIGSKNPLYDDFLMFDDLSSASSRYRYPVGSGGLADIPPEAEFMVRIDEIDRLFSKVIRYLRERTLYVEGEINA